MRGHQSRRIAEGGSLDEGDVATDLFGEEWVMEAKARQTLQVQATLAKALEKAGHGRVLLWWKRLVPGQGSRRTPVAGIAEVVVMTPETLDCLLTAAFNAGKQIQ